MLAGIPKSEIGNIVRFSEFLSLGESQYVLVACQDDGSVEVLVFAATQMIQDADDEYLQRLLAKVVKTLSVALHKESNSLFLD
jgi:hypothetical protein